MDNSQQPYAPPQYPQPVPQDLNPFSMPATQPTEVYPPQAPQSAPMAPHGYEPSSVQAPPTDPGALNFQDLSYSSMGTSSLPPAAGQLNPQMSPQQPMNYADTKPLVPENDPAKPPPTGAFWTLEYYQPYFDVDTIQVATRIKHSITPDASGTFFQLTTGNPDLYGPIWISTTLIFVVAVTANAAHWLSAHVLNTGKEVDQRFTYDFSRMTVAASVIYTYTILGPLCVWGALRYHTAKKNFADLMCLYGYSFTPFLLLSVLCVLPFEWLRWILVLMTFLLSSLFLASNLRAHLRDCFPYGSEEGGSTHQKTYLILGGVVAGQLVFCFIMKLCFFQY